MSDGQYSGSMLQGSLSIVATPYKSMLQAMTRTVLGLTPFNASTILAPAAAQSGNPNRATIMTSTVEVTEISTSVAATDLAVPAGFKQEK